MAKMFDKTVEYDDQTYVQEDGKASVRVYDKKEAMAILGIAHPAQITQLITSGKVGAVGYVPVNEKSGTTKLLLDADSVDAFKLEVRHHGANGVQRFEITIAPADLSDAIDKIMLVMTDPEAGDEELAKLGKIVHALQHAKNLTARSSEYMRDRKRRQAAKDDVMPNGKLHLEA